MLKNFSKKISMLLVCSGLLIFNAVPASASSTLSANEKITSIATTSNTVLTDGGSCTQTVTGGNIGAFSVTVNDSNMRDFSVSSAVPVKTMITAAYPYSNFVSYSSGDYRMFNQVGWHLIPGIQYSILVIPQTTADVTVSMSKSSALTWVVQGKSTNVEKNILTGGQEEDYGIAFDTAGTYRVTVSTGSKLTASLNDTITPYQKVVTLSNNSYVFNNVVVKTPSGSAQNTYTLSLLGNDTVGNGGVYTVTIEKLY